jgi:hypothetical protein
LGLVVVLERTGAWDGAGFWNEPPLARPPVRLALARLGVVLELEESFGVERLELELEADEGFADERLLELELEADERLELLELELEEDERLELLELLEREEDELLLAKASLLISSRASELLPGN